MLTNHLKTAWRTLLNSKGYGTLNILGLAIGMAVTLLIGLWVCHEYSYDTWLPGHEQVYQVRRNFNSNGDSLNFTTVSLKLAESLRNQVPEIAYVAEAEYAYPHGLKAGDKKLYLSGEIVGADFLKIFQFPLLSGKAESVLSDPYSIVLTENTAKALFGNSNPVGKTVRFENKNDLKVAGVLKDLPANSSFQFKYLIPFSYREATDSATRALRAGGFEANAFEIYVRLKPGIAYAQVAPKISGIEWTEKNDVYAKLSTVILQPLDNWHLYGNYENGKETGGFISYVHLFTLIGILVLLIACINFINLTTARSERRAREVGVRKAIGSGRGNLVVQFLVESVLLTFIAFLLSLVFVQLALDPFNALTGKTLSTPYSSPIFWLTALTGVGITALAAGSRPAFYLSSFQPVQVLKGTFRTGKAVTFPRQILVVLQFSCSIALIISTVIIYQQITYARQRPMGYNIDRLIVTDGNDELQRNYTALRNELLQKGIVESMTTSTSPATDVWWHSELAQWPGKLAGETMQMGINFVTSDYFSTMNMRLLEGRVFDQDADSQSVICNEAAIRRMRIKNPINQSITFQGRPLRIVGVMRDALMTSPFAPAEPTIFLYSAQPQHIILYRLSRHIGTPDGLAQLTAIFNRYAPAYPYSYAFVDRQYEAKFDLEVLVGKLSGVFAGLAIFISCLGLFGLAAFVAEQRTKEIGVRKVLGASTSGLWLLLSKDFILLVAISCVIASPLAYYLLHHWLQQYSYRIEIGVGVFAGASFLALLITMATISIQAIKAAVANPVKSLRSE